MQRRERGRSDRRALDADTLALFGSVYRTELRLKRNAADAEDLAQKTQLGATRLWAWIGATLVLASAAVYSSAQLAGAQRYDALEPNTLAAWQQIRMDGLTVIGTASAAELRKIANGIAAFRSALSTLLPNVRVSGSVPTFVTVLKDFEAYKRYQPRDSRGRRAQTVAAYLNIGATANFLVFPYVPDDVGRALIYHEYTHYVLRQNADTEIPLWLEEGLAEYYSTFRPDFKDGTLIGAASPERLRTLRQGPYISIRNLVSLRNSGQIVRSTRAALFYAESWALVHYITMERRNLVQAPLEIYLRTLAATASQDDAFKAAFGVTVEGMDRELSMYVRRYSFRTMVIPRAETQRIDQVEPTSRADAQALEAALLDGRRMPEEFESDLPPF